NLPSAYNLELITSGEFTAPVPPALEEDSRSRLYVLKKYDGTDDGDSKKGLYLTSVSGYCGINAKGDYGTYVYGHEDYSVWKGKITDAGEIIDTLQLINIEKGGNMTNCKQLGL